MNASAIGDALTREGIVLAILAGVLSLGGVLLLALRTRALPVCWNCGHNRVRRSRSHCLLDTLARVGLLRPYRCEKCLHRFYCFLSGRLPRNSGRRSIAASGIS